jgi:hypothetical protein
MIKLLRIPVPKDRLRLLSKDERVLLILLSYTANQIAMMEKILIFSLDKDPATETERYLEGAQSQMLVRILIGVVNEAWNLVSTRFVRNQIGQQYMRLLDAGGQTSLSRLKRQFGSSNLLPKIRNTYSFHHPD